MECSSLSPKWACSAVGSAPEWHSGGHRFDPGQVHHPSLACSRERATGGKPSFALDSGEGFTAARAHVPDRRRVSTVAPKARRWTAETRRHTAAHNPRTREICVDANAATVMFNCETTNVSWRIFGGPQVALAVRHDREPAVRLHPEQHLAS